jgi:hypothetical protein
MVLTMVYNTQNCGFLDSIHRPVFENVPSVQFCSTDGASCGHEMISQHSQINPYMLHHNFYCTLFPVISLRQSLVSGIYIAVVILTWVVQ